MYDFVLLSDLEAEQVNGGSYVRIAKAGNFNFSPASNDLNTVVLAGGFGFGILKIENEDNKQIIKSTVTQTATANA